MCSHAIPMDMNEKIEYPNSSQAVEYSEKVELPVTPPDDLVVLAPDYSAKQMQTVLQEGILLASGGVAILLQVAHPGVAKGVDKDSNFAYRPGDRLRTTMTFMYCMTFGSPEEKRAIIEMVHRAHTTVKGVDYDADDAELQLWVAATLYACGVHVHEMIFGPLDSATADKVYHEYSIMGTSLRVPPGLWPETLHKFWEYWDDKIETLEITSHAKNVAKDLLYNKKGPIWLKANLPLVRLLTAEWLPPRMRDEYGLKTSQTKKTMYRFTVAFVRAVYPHLPKKIRQYPLKYYLGDMRKRMSKMEKSQRVGA